MSITIEMVNKTCYCGMVYSVPGWMQNRTSFPACAWMEKNKLVKENEGLYRQIASPRGVITKIKNRKGK